MMNAFADGISIETLMVRYTLSRNRVLAVLADERNRRAASPDEYYRDVRGKG